MGPGDAVPTFAVAGTPPQALWNRQLSGPTPHPGVHRGMSDRRGQPRPAWRLGSGYDNRQRSSASRGFLKRTQIALEPFDKGRAQECGRGHYRGDCLVETARRPAAHLDVG